MITMHVNVERCKYNDILAFARNTVRVVLKKLLNISICIPPIYALHVANSTRWVVLKMRSEKHPSIQTKYNFTMYFTGRTQLRATTKSEPAVETAVFKLLVQSAAWSSTQYTSKVKNAIFY